MEKYGIGYKARYDVTMEEQRYLFKISVDYAISHCVAEDL